MKKTGKNEARMERGAGVALWRQVADAIRQSIASGEHGDSNMLPPETALAARYSVNRHTVRSALAALAAEGAVKPVQGVGTLIRQARKLRLPLSRRTRFSEGVGAQAKETNAALLSDRTEPAGREIAEALGLSEGALCVVLETTHSADGMPVSTASNWFEARRFHDMPEQVRKCGSVSAALAACGVADYARLSTEISAAHATGEDLHRLGLSPGAIVLESLAVNIDAGGRPIQFSHSRFDAGRSSLVITFESPG